MPIPHILFLYWGKDRPLSWLRWLTVKSFSLCNPDWDIIVYYPETIGLRPTWATGEHKDRSRVTKDWFPLLTEAGKNVSVQKAPILDLPNLPEVHRSDLLRWRLLSSRGGWWSDFDILYFRPMSVLKELLDPEADAFLCWGEVPELKNWQAIGLLAGKEGSPLFYTMEQEGLLAARRGGLKYQDLGEVLLKQFVKVGDTDACGSRIGQIPQSSVYPFSGLSGQARALWEDKSKLVLTESTVGVHWFGGQKASFAEELRLTGPEVKWWRGGVFQAYASCMARYSDEGGSGMEEVEDLTLRYSIIMPYVNRGVQLWNTMMSFNHWYSDRDDWEVIIVEDARNCMSPTSNAELRDIIKEWRDKGLRIELVGPVGLRERENNPSQHFNEGAVHARGSFLVLTSPEVLHKQDVLGGLDAEFKKSKDCYVICACEAINSYTPRKLNKISELPSGTKHWYQHGTFRPADYHFCSALSRENWVKISGFDEDFVEGYCFDDDDFRERVRAEGIQFSRRDDLLVCHQAHSQSQMTAELKRRWALNKARYEAKWGLYTPIHPPAKKGV